MGRNGMGKTTTIRSILGMTRAGSGAIRFGGQEVRACRRTRLQNSASAWCRKAGKSSEPHRARKSGRGVRQRLGVSDPWTLEKIHALFPRLASAAATWV